MVETKTLMKSDPEYHVKDELTGLYPPLNLPVKHIAIDGRPYPISFPEEELRNKSEFNAKEGDVTVATYPRSGTELVLGICKELHALQGVEVPGKENPFVSRFQRGGKRGGRGGGPGPRPEAPADMPTRTLLTRTHNYYQHLNIDSEKMKVIHVYRDPKDVVCSLYLFMQKDRRKVKLGFEGDFSECVDWFLKGGLVNGCYWEFNREYLLNEDGHKILHLTYEELVLEKPAAVQRINSFLGYNELSEDDVASVDKATSLDPSKLKPGQHGKPGRAKEMLTEEQRRRFNERSRAEFEGFSGIPQSYYTDEN